MRDESSLQETRATPPRIELEQSAGMLETLFFSLTARFGAWHGIIVMSRILGPN